MIDEPTLFDVWKEYEATAKHFNELILNLRVQALGGVTATSAIVSVFINKDSFLGTVRWPALGFAFCILAVLWAALACLDLFYYNRLLLGAVDAIMALEYDSMDPSRWPGLNLSRTITHEVDRSWLGPAEPNPSRKGTSTRAPKVFYAIVFVILIVVAVFSFAQR